MADRDDRIDAEQRQGDGSIGDILHRVGDDVKTIAKDEVELARLERSVRSAAAEAGVVVLGAVVALIGLGLLCVSVVDALEPVIAPLWLRLLIMAAVYVLLGGAVVGVFTGRFKRHIPPDMSRVTAHAERTVETVRRQLRTR
jgi:Putative Actinobacterial Holin-X, holin superfamily III